MRAEDVTGTVDMVLEASGREHVHVQNRPRLPSDNGPSHIAEELADHLDKNGMDHVRRALPSASTRQDRAVASDAQEPHAARKLLPTRRSRASDRGLRRALRSLRRRVAKLADGRKPKPSPFQV